jgi:hypothetical protein
MEGLRAPERKIFPCHAKIYPSQDENKRPDNMNLLSGCQALPALRRATGGNLDMDPVAWHDRTVLIAISLVV